MKYRNPKSESRKSIIFFEHVNFSIVSKFVLRASNLNNSGQVVLMLVLITIVGLTIGLSLISRTVTDIRISSQLEQSGRAFSAAEAGVENALKGAVVGGPVATIALPDATASYAVTQVGNSAGVLSFPLTSIGNTQTVWLIDHNPDGITLNEDTGYSYPAASSFDICWGTDSSLTPAMVISLYYKSGTTYKVARGAYDANAVSRGNNFSAVDSAGNYCDSNFRFKKTITPTTDFGLAASDKLLFLRVAPAYENTTFAIKPTANLPAQGKVITSVGQTNTGVVRKIQVTQGYNVLPAVFDFALFGENQ